MKSLLLLITLLSHHCLAAMVTVDGVDFTSLSAARTAIKDGSRIYLQKGVYAVGAYIKASDIELIGEEGVVFDNAIADEKAALVFTGNNITVESIECRNIAVKDKNGACIRFEGQHLTVRNLYAHDSQAGILTNRDAGNITIEYSKFERLGGKGKGVGYAHAVYAFADELRIYRSEILSMRESGSGIKSRSKKTVILESRLATINGDDSRLIDTANFGELIVQKSILQQGDNSTNRQLIAYGLEKKVERLFDVNSIEIKNNIFILDRAKSSVIVSYRLADKIEITDNVYIGDFLYTADFLPNNTWYSSRNKAFIAELPYIPKLEDFDDIIFRATTYGTAEHP
ncbi:hypothetical protein KO525_01025 [Psychrosphaera sp. B3R10]|uniref:right-handed parallel beta-helix repeat-containing protein n=1 Tax=unclassified Psychrosphaera TaxID=2641570 RepID=UPI001C0A3E61|nr:MULTISPECIES: right-handed parallel beta-helix repeat-containing protein [unclassified Psychrosphaera]MBU2883729.1 hypothetical protein [Psychrosphaera sp. I2R16]MBU2987969.1 hypothetical protein [Psychrosphaera sp. B3R10]